MKAPVGLAELEAGRSLAAGAENLAALTDRFTPGELDHDLTRNARRGGEPLGERIIVSGRVLDDRGGSVRGTLIEIWQANAGGRYSHKADNHDAPVDSNFLGAGRCVTDGEGRYRFLTIQPGAYPWQNHHNAWRPRHIHFSVIGGSPIGRLVTQMYFPGPLRKGEAPYICMIVFMRGMLLHVCTRIYFADEAANSNDPVLSRLPGDRRETLLARREPATDPAAYHFDIHMQGKRETLFFKPARPIAV